VQSDGALLSFVGEINWDTPFFVKLNRLRGKLPGQACVVGLFPIVSGVSCSPQSAAGSDFDFVTKHPRSVPRFPASRENRRRFRCRSSDCT
jgi:hypothetical protein